LTVSRCITQYKDYIRLEGRWEGVDYALMFLVEIKIYFSTEGIFFLEIAGFETLSIKSIFFL